MGIRPVPLVFVDSNVWYSRTCRDWFGILRTVLDDEPFHILWSEDVLAELMYHLRKSHPEWDGRRITDIRDQLAGTFELGRVEDYTIDPDYAGPDQHDAHVHAAALSGRADYLVTFNTQDFEWVGASNWYEVAHPDVCFQMIDDTSPQHVAAATEAMTKYWLGKRGEADLPRQLRRADCPGFAERVRRHLQHLM